MKKTFALMAAGADLGSVTSIATLDINHLLSTEHNGWLALSEGDLTPPSTRGTKQRRRAPSKWLCGVCCGLCSSCRSPRLGSHRS